MKDKQLLSVMFDDAAGLREQLLGETLRRVRRKRRMRQCGQALMAMAVLAAMVWWTIPRRATFDLPAPVNAGVHFVHTQPLPAEQVVETKPVSIAVIASDKATVAFLDDDRLLDLVPGETKLLVWHAPHEAELVIVGP